MEIKIPEAGVMITDGKEKYLVTFAAIVELLEQLKIKKAVEKI